MFLMILKRKYRVVRVGKLRLWSMKTVNCKEEITQEKYSLLRDTSIESVVHVIQLLSVKCLTMNQKVLIGDLGTTSLLEHVCFG